MAVEIVPAPPVELRPLGLFTQTVPEVPWNPRFGRGVTFQPVDLTDLTVLSVPDDAPCSTESDLAAARACKAYVTQTGFNLLDQVSDQANVFGGTAEDDLRADISRRWPLVVSEAIAREFLTGTAGSTHNLTADAGAAVATPATVHGGIAELEEEMALGLGNTLGMIHMTPSALVYAVTNGSVNYNNGRYYSPGGHLVVADAGYQVAETTTTAMFGTGAVLWSMGPRDSRLDTLSDGMDWGTKKNTLLWVEQAMAIFWYDPDTVWLATATKA